MSPAALAVARHPQIAREAAHKPACLRRAGVYVDSGDIAAWEVRNVEPAPHAIIVNNHPTVSIVPRRIGASTYSNPSSRYGWQCTAISCVV